MLKKWFGTSFKDNGNSYDTCFQFVGNSPEGQLQIRVKYYWKTMALIQSETVMKSIGMNMKGLF